MSPTRMEVIVADCDNTLWGGAVGELGTAGGILYRVTTIIYETTISNLLEVSSSVDHGLLVRGFSCNNNKGECSYVCALAIERQIAGISDLIIDRI